MLQHPGGIYSQAQGEVTQAPTPLSHCVSLREAMVRCSEAALLMQLAQHPHTYATRPTHSQQHTKAS